MWTLKRPRSARLGGRKGAIGTHLATVDREILGKSLPVVAGPVGSRSSRERVIEPLTRHRGPTCQRTPFTSSHLALARPGTALSLRSGPALRRR